MKKKVENAMACGGKVKEMSAGGKMGKGYKAGGMISGGMNSMPNMKAKKMARGGVARGR